MNPAATTIYEVRLGWTLPPVIHCPKCKRADEGWHKNWNTGETRHHIHKGFVVCRAILPGTGDVW